MSDITDTHDDDLDDDVEEADPNLVPCGRCNGTGQHDSPPWNDTPADPDATVARAYPCPQCEGTGTMRVH